MGCGLTFDKLLRAELQAKLLRGGLRLSYCGAGQVTEGRGELRARMCQHLRCELVVGQVTAGRATG